MIRIKAALLTSILLLAVPGVAPGRGAGRLLAFQGNSEARGGSVQTPAPPLLNVARLQVYQGRLVRTANSLPMRSSLAELLRMVMRDADEDTSGRRVDEDYRAALVALMFYVNGWPLESAAPEAKAWPKPPGRTIVLSGRHDLAQHFTVSAVIAAFAGTALAAAAGLYKELEDARGGSGFSFSDLAADRAGTMFGEMAGGSPESARRLQSRLTVKLAEDDIMPAITGLPDNLSQAELTRRFGGVGAPAYNEIVLDIDRRVAALALFQEGTSPRPDGSKSTSERRP